MELLALLLSSVFTVAGSGGTVLDFVAQDLLRDRIRSAEQLEVRIDNTPNYQILSGNLDRLRLAGRGVEVLPDLRIQTLELETDPISIEPSSLRRGRPRLRRPLAAAFRVVVRAEDLNRALQSPRIQRQLQRLVRGLSGAGSQLVNPQIQFLGNNRIRLQGSLQTPATNVTASLEVTVQPQQGSRLQLLNPVLSLGDQTVPASLYRGFLDGLSQQYDLRRFQAQGITARLLQLNSSPGQLEIIAYARTERLP